VLKELERGEYGMIQYTRHGVFDKDNPDESYLPFRVSRETGD
jgi:hypothetical protein